MPNLRYYNQSGPFWDWIAELEASAGNNQRSEAQEAGNQFVSHPWFSGFPFQRPEGAESGYPHPSRGPFQFPHRGPPPPPAPPGAAVPPPQDSEMPEPPSDADGPSGPPDADEPTHRGPHHHHHRGGPGGWGPHGRGGCRRGGFGGGRRGRGPFGAWGHPFMNGGDRPGHPFDLGAFVQNIAQQFGGNMNQDGENKDKSDKDFTPPVDVFDTPEAFVLHFSLAGARKEDVGVNWDADKSELSVAGVIYRLGDEEMLKTLAMDEREVGVFERKVRLGSRANPAVVDSDSITAKMEDGILVVTVPKTEEFVEIKKVDIE